MTGYLKKNLAWMLESGRVTLAKLAGETGLPSSSIGKGDVRYIENWVKISEISGFTLDMLVHTDLETKDRVQRKGIKMLCFDIDGVLTDGGMNYTEGGDEFKKFNTRDGMGIKMAVSQGFIAGFLSHGVQTNLISKRAALLGVKYCYVGSESKLNVLKGWVAAENLSLSNVAYIGDDINDLEMMDAVGLSACPNDAEEIMKKNAHVILSKNGGAGCAREFIERYIIQK